MTTDWPIERPNSINRQEDQLHYIWTKGDDSPLVSALVENFQEKDGSTFAEVTITWHHGLPPDPDPIIGPARVNLTSAHHSGWKSLVKSCEEAVDNATWMPALQSMVTDAIRYHRSGQAPTRLGQMQRHEFGDPYLLRPFISSSGVTVHYGQGGLSKSLFALLQGFSVATGIPVLGVEPSEVGPVIFFDYEDDHIVHDQRLLAICKALGVDPINVPILHMGLTSKVISSKNIMRRRISEAGAKLIVLDSIGMARGGDAIGPDDTIRLFRTLRGFNVPVLAIDHIAKMDKREQSNAARLGRDVDAYGSTYTMNAARLAYWMRPVNTDGSTIKLEMRNTKANHVQRVDPMGFRITYHNDERGIPERITVERVDDFGEEMELLSKPRILVNLLKTRGPMFVQDIAQEMGWREDTIYRVLSEDRKGQMPVFRKIGTKRPHPIDIIRQKIDEPTVEPTVEPTEEPTDGK